MAAKHHVNLKVVEEFLRRKIYPKEIAKDKDKKANFRRTCKNFSIKNGELFYKKSRKVIFDEQQKIEIVHDIPEGIGENARSKAICHQLLENNFFQFKTLVQNRAKIFCCNIMAMCKKVD